MTNANPLISLRNTAIIWIASAVACFFGAWWLYHFLSDEGNAVMAEIETSKASLQLLKDEGAITKKDWNDMTNPARQDERWNTIRQLVPSVTNLIGIGTPAAAANIQTMKTISQKTGDQPYITWLKSSWTPEAQDALAAAQSDIAEIIPLFAGISEVSATEDIHGKITLKSLIDYIQSFIVDAFSLGNVVGDIGIQKVQFMEDTPEIGVYEIPLRFENIPNQNILKLTGFLRKTGGVIVSENGNTLKLEHQEPLNMESASANISSLKNLLITVKSLDITPTKLDVKNAKEPSLTTKTNQFWDVSLVLRFYIRGVSRDHIAALDSKIDTWLNRGNTPTSLITQSTKLLSTCGKCAQASEIRDIASLLANARAAYDSIIINEKTSKTPANPLETLERRTALITTIETLKQKLDTLSTLLSSPIQ